MKSFDIPFQGVVKPQGWLFHLLDGVLKRAVRKKRWKSYYRACRRIPKDSPVYGTTSWRKINERRCKLIAKHIACKDEKKIKSPEYHALQAVASEICKAELVVSNFVMRRWLRRNGVELNPCP